MKKQQRPSNRESAHFFRTPLMIVLLLITGCAGTSRQPENHAINQILVQDVGSIDQKLAARIMSEKPSLKTKTHSKVREKVEGEIHKRVWWWMNYYTVRDRDRFERNLNRGENYRPLVQQILRQHELPAELYYLAMIESGYVTRATSTASAVGIWQFMRPTALHYGLGVNEHFDERRSPIAATEAAAKYLLFLNKKFGSWYLAIAAYNAGQGRISAAVKRGKTHDFWTLADRRLIPQETMDYIPKFLAAASIGSHLSQFGFAPLQVSTQQWPEIASINFKLWKHPKTQLSDIAFQTAVSEKDLVRFNPQIKQVLASSSMSPGMKKIRLWIPKDSANSFIARQTKTKTVAKN